MGKNEHSYIGSAYNLIIYLQCAESKKKYAGLKMIKKNIGVH